MRKIILPIFLLLSLIVKSQTLSIDSSLEMTIKGTDSIRVALYLFEEETYSERKRADNISFKLISQSYFNSLDFATDVNADGNVLDLRGKELTMPDEIPNVVLLISSDFSVYSRRIIGEAMVTGYQLLQVDQILALKSIIDEVYKFRKNKNFNFSFGDELFGISGNFTNGKLFLNFFRLYSDFYDENDFLSNLNRVNSIDNQSKFAVTLNLDQIKSMRKFLKKALKP